MSEPEDDARQTPADMQAWLRYHIEEVTRASALRLKEATDFVTAYSTGKISLDEAEERSDNYLKRWGEAIPGVILNPGMTDADIYKKMDEMEAQFGDGDWSWVKYQNQGKGGKGRSGV